MRFVRTLLVILLFSTLIFGVLLLAFRLKRVTVTGNVHYSDAQIRAMCGDAPVPENALVFCLWNRQRAVPEACFIDRIEAEMTDRNTVALTVREKKFAGYYFENGRYWYFDAMGNVTAESEEAESPENPYIPYVNGIAPGRTALGDILPDAGSRIYERIGIMGRFIEEGARTLPDAVFVRDGAVFLTYGKVEAALGAGDHMEEKLTALYSILPDAAGLCGTLHLETWSENSTGYVFTKNE